MIRLSGYTEDEKLAIATQYLVPKQLGENGLGEQNITFLPKALRELIRYYTREAGVRGLERELASLCRKLAKKHVEKHLSAKLGKESLSKSAEEHTEALKDFDAQETVSIKTIHRHLGPRRYRVGAQNFNHEVGMCTGLAWTQVGGDLLTIEVSVLPGKGKLMLTGKLGEVMQESAQAAFSYVRSRSTFLGIAEDFYTKVDIHIHVPEGAIPKDGPSAGTCMATALTSALTNRPVSKDIAMTGEITLRGKVLPIGGLKEKIFAAHRAGIKKVIIPKENEKDLRDIPKNIMKDVTIELVTHMDQVLIHALVWQSDESSTKKDELFEKLKKVNEVTEAAAQMAH
jgi:ATP-dependent Lon protease